MRANREYQICKAISVYLKLAYPKILFHFDLAGLNLSMAQSGMMKAIQGGRGFPDLFIMDTFAGWHGLFLEVKAVTPYLKDGITLKSNKHLQEQQKMHQLLQRKGYQAMFVTGFDEAKIIIDAYLK